LVDTLNSSLEKNPNLDLESIDGIINSIQEAAQKQQEAEAKKAAAAEKASKKKPALQKA